MSIEIISPSEQVAAHLRAQLFNQRWKTELPGTPTLAEEFGVDRKTVIAAIKHLEEEGLLQSQGPGRCRKIILPKNTTKPTRLDIRLIVYEHADRQAPYILELLHQVQGIGHNLTIASKAFNQLGMDLGKVSAFVEEHPADAWIVAAPSLEILEWFAAQSTPTFAIFGRRREVKIASVGPDKTMAIRTVVQRLVDLGHRRIVYLVREERRKPMPGALEREFLKVLKSSGIPSGPYNLPDWEDNRESFINCLDRLFEYTPPTALIVDEAQFFLAAQHHLSQTNIIAPRDISMICCDTHQFFDWCHPEISHISWEYRPVVDHAVHWVSGLARGKNERKPSYTSANFVEGGTIGPAPKRY